MRGKRDCNDFARNSISSIRRAVELDHLAALLDKVSLVADHCADKVHRI